MKQRNMKDNRTDQAMELENFGVGVVLRYLNNIPWNIGKLSKIDGKKIEDCQC